MRTCRFIFRIIDRNTDRTSHHCRIHIKKDTINTILFYKSDMAVGGYFRIFSILFHCVSSFPCCHHKIMQHNRTTIGHSTLQSSFYSFISIHFSITFYDLFILIFHISSISSKLFPFVSGTIFQTNIPERIAIRPKSPNEKA